MCDINMFIFDNWAVNEIGVLYHIAAINNRA